MVPSDFRTPQSRIPEIPKKSSVAPRHTFPLVKSSLQNRSHRFAHSFFPLLSCVNPSSRFNVPQHSCRVRLFTLTESEGPRRTAPRQRHRSISPRIAATPASIQLRVSDFGVILKLGQTMYATFY